MSNEEKKETKKCLDRAKREWVKSSLGEGRSVAVLFPDGDGGWLMVPIRACKNSQFWARENHKSVGNKNCLLIIHAKYFLNSPQFIN